MVAGHFGYASSQDNRHFHSGEELFCQNSTDLPSHPGQHLSKLFLLLSLVDILLYLSENECRTGYGGESKNSTILFGPICGKSPDQLLLVVDAVLSLLFV